MKKTRLCHALCIGLMQGLCVQKPGRKVGCMPVLSCCALQAASGNVDYSAHLFLGNIYIYIGRRMGSMGSKTERLSTQPREREAKRETKQEKATAPLTPSPLVYGNLYSSRMTRSFASFGNPKSSSECVCGVASADPTRREAQTIFNMV